MMISRGRENASVTTWTCGLMDLVQEMAGTTIQVGLVSSGTTDIHGKLKKNLGGNLFIFTKEFPGLSGMSLSRLRDAPTIAVRLRQLLVLFELPRKTIFGSCG